MLENTSSNAITNPTDSTRQPRGLYLLFFTELWERFGFYTLQAIIILYMTKALLMSDANANLLYAAFSALLYLTPTLGGYIADKFLGFQRSITLGGILFIIGYLLCSSPDKTIFFLGLGVLVCANGFFKPNVSSIVGELYTKNDPRRDGGFTLFYMGINIGALIPPLITGALVAKFGWHSGFWLAAFGMFIGQMIFQSGKKELNNAGHSTKKLSPLFYFFLTSGIVLTVALCQMAFQHPQLANYAVEIGAAGILIVVSYHLSHLPVDQRNKMFAALVLVVISVVFWAIYNQAFTSLMLYADRHMQKEFFGIPFDAYATQFFNPFFLIALSPVLSRMWIRMDQKHLNPSIQLKFVLSLIFLSAGFFLLAIGTKYFSHQGVTGSDWVAASYFLQTIGELLISPIGLAMITVLSPKHLVGMMMGVWFFAQAASFSIGGFLANIAAVPEQMAAVQSLPIYTHAFVVYGFISLAAAIISLALVPFLGRMIRHQD